MGLASLIRRSTAGVLNGVLTGDRLVLISLGGLMEQKVKRQSVLLMLCLFLSANGCLAHTGNAGIKKDTGGIKIVKMEITDLPFLADYYYSSDPKPGPGIIVLGGSEGGKPSYLAEPLAAQGHSLLALAYFKESGLPETLEMIPLEYFDAPIQWLKNKHSAKTIVLVGISKGAELALLLGSMRKDISGVIVYSPSSVVFEGFGNNPITPQSSWTRQGRPVPFVPFDATGVANMNDYYAIYKQSLTQADTVGKAAIPVEQVNGPILLFSGTDDRMWPSGPMAETIVARLASRNFEFKFTHIRFEGAGHVFSEYFTQLGGTAEANKAARLGAMEATIGFLKNFER
jgi:dienelactone hydrolase